MTDIAARLLAWRKSNNLSQAQASDVMASYNVPITVGAIRAWEQGRPPGKMAVSVLQTFLRDHPTIEDPPARYPGHRPGRSDKEKAKMRAMHDKGMEMAKIGRKFGITESGVSRILSRQSLAKDYPEILKENPS
jgi:transcriptional regulator with XRE-family HTH domain